MSNLRAVITDTLRSLRGRPLGNLAVVLVLAMGLTAVVSVSSIADLVMHSDPAEIPSERLFTFGVGVDAASSRSILGSEALALRRDIPGLQEAALIRPADFNLAPVSAAGGARAERVSGALVDGDPFALLGWKMALGAGFRAENFKPGAAPVVVIGDLLWRTRYGADPAVIGTEIRIDGTPAKVVGVLGERLAYPFQQQIYRATHLASEASLQTRWWQPLVRVDDRAIVQSTTAAIAAQQTERVRLHGDDAKREVLRFGPVWDSATNPETYLLMIVLAVVVGLVMVMAASNAGGLLLVQWLARSRELATRHALGASSARVVGSLLAHSVALVTAAWLLAVLLSALILDAFGAYLNQTDNGMPLFMSFQLSPSVLGISAGVAISAAMLLTLPTWLRLRRGAMAIELRSGARSTSGALSRFGRVLFGLQSLLAVITVLATLQAAIGAREQQTRAIGLDSDAVLVAQVDGNDAAAKAAFAQRLRERLAVEAGVAAVSISANLPIALSGSRDVTRGEQRLKADFAPVDVGYRDVYQLPLRNGVWFSADDVRTERAVAVIDPTLAAAMFPNSDPIGQSLSIAPSAGAAINYVIVGVSESVRLSSATGPDQPTVFVPMSAAPVGPLAIALRVSGAPRAAISRLLAIGAEINPDFALTHVGSFAQRRAQANEWSLMVLGLFAPLGILALVLAATGLAALLGSLVNDRIREIGLRRALGATPAKLVRGLMAGLARWGCVGALIGIACAVALVSPLGQMLYGESQVGAVAVLGTLCALGLVLVIAVTGPLRRALAIAPMVALRND